MFEWAYEGVNSSIPRNVGPDCANYLTLKRRIIETLFISLFIIFFIAYGRKRATLPKNVSYAGQDRVGRRVLLIMMSLVLGMEIGFKFTSRTVIYLLNPCHITTAIQVCLSHILILILNSSLLSFSEYYIKSYCIYIFSLAI